MQHPVVKRRLDLVGVHRRGQLQHPLESAEAALAAVPPPLDVLVGQTLALQRQLIAVRHRHLQLVVSQTRQLGVEMEGVAVLPHIHRREGRHRQTAADPRPVVQQTVHLPVQPIETRPQGRQQSRTVHRFIPPLNRIILLCRLDSRLPPRIVNPLEAGGNLIRSKHRARTGPTGREVVLH